MTNIEALQSHSLDSYLYHMRQKTEEKLTPRMAIIGPWSDQITPEERASYHLWLLSKTYGKGHPGSVNTQNEIKNKQTDNELLTWIVTLNNHPVGMVNLEIAEGIAEVVRSVELPKGTILSNGEIYKGDANISAAMYQRIPDILANDEISRKIRVVEGDVRLAREIQLPTGEVLASGVRTQHINAVTGLNPLLLCVPRYQVHPENGRPHQEAFLQSRKYLKPEDLDLTSPLYLTQDNGSYPSLSDIVMVTYPRAWDIIPTIISTQSSYQEEPNLYLDNVAGIHFSQLRVAGNLTQESIYQAIRTGLDKSRFLEIIIINNPGNIILQKNLQKIPEVVPLGVLPGEGENPATLHYGITRPEITKQIVEIELARDYQNTPLENIVMELRERWQKIGVNYE